VIRRLSLADHGIEAVVSVLERSPASVSSEIHGTVEEILTAVRARGDAALLEYAARFDGYGGGAAGLRISDGDQLAAERQIPPDVRSALAHAASRIERYHKEAAPRSWRITDDNGSVLGQEVRPLDRVGIYVPGGRAAYPSTVLMTAIPARVAGVREIVLVTPPAGDGTVASVVLAAARIAGITEAYRVGGAQAIAALAYGTSSIRRVDKIVGPGNVYVALAKARVFGMVGIDMLAGPSEVIIIADGAAEPAWVAADLLAQAEHDPMARSVLITDSDPLLSAVAAELERQLCALPRQAIAAASLMGNGALVFAADLTQAVELANALAPEHLELQVSDPERLLPAVRHAGAVFLGRYSPEVVGDYLAGPSHVLPTAGTARFASPLGVEDFVKRFSVVSFSERGLSAARLHLRSLARVEGLDGHARSADVRSRSPEIPDGTPTALRVAP
jgi:histidinol dehydrogenase